MKRVKHYCSYGSGLAFSCYYKDLEKYIEENYKREPLKTTNLKQVTCPECWKAILSIATTKC